MEDTKEFKKPIIHIPENVPVNYEFERMLKNFTKQVEKSGILQEVKSRKFYIKPSEKNRLTKKSQKRRI